MKVEGRANGSNGATSEVAQRPKDWCPLFDLLTFDLRWQVYQYAFAGRVVHIYLLYSRALQSDARWRKNHQPIASWLPHSPGVVLAAADLLSTDPGSDQTKRWHWWSCVCGLDEELGGGAPRRRGMEMSLREPCPKGIFPRESEESGTRVRDDTFLGIMGWLTSCRKANYDTLIKRGLPLVKSHPRGRYDETIHLLYASTTFRLEERLQALYFPYAIPQPQRSWVTSLDVRITDYDESMLDPSLGSAPAPTPTSQPPSELRRLAGREQYRRILATAAASFPGLRRLHVTFESSVRPSADGDDPTGRIRTTTLGEMDRDELEQAVLGPIDSLPAVVQRQVVFFRSIYAALLQTAREKQPTVEWETCEGPGGFTRFWRRLDREQCERGGYWIYQLSQ